jgi:hypothetical protein
MWSVRPHVELTVHSTRTPISSYSLRPKNKCTSTILDASMKLQIYL